MLTSQVILIISPEPWSHIFVSKHHYAIELSKKGNDVYFLNPPSHVSEIEIGKSEFERLNIINYSIPFKGQRFLPFFLNRIVDGWLIKRIEQKAKCIFTIIWNFENSRFYDFKFLSRKVLKIYHQVDLNQNFHPKLAASTADICFCTSDVILKNLVKENAQAYKIHHGFSELVYKKSEGFIELPNEHNMPVAMLVGNIDYNYLDIDLLQRIIRENPDVFFVFAGPYTETGVTYNKLSSFLNTTFLGRIESVKINGLLEQADMLLVTYNANEWEQMSSPHKLMEYFGSGKVIVATYTDEYKDKRYLLAMADKCEEYATLFRKVKSNLEIFNAEERQMERIQFAKDNSYSRQIEKIEWLIEQYFATK